MSPQPGKRHLQLEMAASPTRIGLITLLIAVALPLDAAHAQSLPVPPCAGMPNPTAGDVGASLEQLVWVDDDSLEWSPPACTGWADGPSKALLAAAGRFRMDGDTETIARHLARISGMVDLIYWSSTRSKWRKLFKAATALSAPDRRAVRDDFSPDELIPDAELYYWLEEDNPTAGVVYQVVVHERAPGRLVFETINRTPIKARLLFFRPEVAEPGEFRQLYYIEHEAGDTWRYYSLVRMREAGSLVGTSAANYQNRAEAFFRYLAGLKMDREPPAAP